MQNIGFHTHTHTHTHTMKLRPCHYNDVMQKRVIWGNVWHWVMSDKIWPYDILDLTHTHTMKLWMQGRPTNKNSTLVRKVAWYRQTSSKFMSPYSVTVYNDLKTVKITFLSVTVLTISTSLELDFDSVHGEPSVSVFECVSENLICAKVWEWISNFILNLTGHVITYPCWDWSSSMFVNGAANN